MGGFGHILGQRPSIYTRRGGRPGFPVADDETHVEIQHAIDSVEHSQGCLSRDVPKRSREGRRVWTVVVYDWQHGNGGVHKEADGRRGEDDVCDGVVNSEEGDDEACHEEEDGDVKKGRNGLNGNGHLKAGYAVVEKRADAGTLMDRDLRLRQLEVKASPALLECCK